MTTTTTTTTPEPEQEHGPEGGERASGERASMGHHNHMKCGVLIVDA